MLSFTLLVLVPRFSQAGFETSSNTLSTLTYNLATHPEVQERIRQELENLLKDSSSDSIDTDLVSNMTYLDAAITENMRMYPPVTKINRECLEDAKVGGMLIRKGTLVQIPIWAMQRDPIVYPDPEKFQPERFLGEGVKQDGGLRFMAFGGGPRKCIGMR